MSKKAKNIYIYRSSDLTDQSEQTAQEQILESLYGDDYVFLVYEDGGFIANENDSSVLIQEYVE